ncbi:MAG TPA: AAA family ATPase [Chthonomonadales bacterium]|nr:AAA family ATPase [Chthonomonadales bacterium]
MAREREFGDGREHGRDDPWSDLPETNMSALGMVNDLIRATPRGDSRLDYLLLLRHQIETDAKQFEEARDAIGQLQEAYEKLTSPANRLGVFLGWSDEGARICLVALGDQEFVANVDPEMDAGELRVGVQVRLNEAYVVVGQLGYHLGGHFVKVSEVKDAARLRVAADPTGSASRIVFRSQDLLERVVKPGDEVRVDPMHRVALEHLSANEARDYFLEEVPEIPWSMVGGQSEAIQVIKDAIELPLLHPDLFARFEKRPLKGILLYGPPGCGKTLIGRATAYNLTREYRERTQRDVKEYFMYINGPKILNMWLGETERMVRSIFDTAREKAKDGNLVFVFVDEAESILRTRSSGRWLNISNTVVPQFCAEMDGLVQLDNVVVMLTSNRPDYIDPAVLRPERIDRRVKIARPDRAASRDILAIYLHSGIPYGPALVRDHKGDVDAARAELLDLATDYLWRRAPDTQVLDVHLRSGSIETLHWRDLVSGALLKSAVERAKDFAIKRAIGSGSDQAGITLEDLREAIRVEYKENEIFPKSDTLEDWLKLVDYEPENVVTVRPVRERKIAPPSRRDII